MSVTQDLWVTRERKYHFNLSNYQTLEIIAVKNRSGGYVKISMKIL